MEAEDYLRIKRQMEPTDEEVIRSIVNTADVNNQRHLMHDYPREMLLEALLEYHKRFGYGYR